MGKHKHAWKLTRRKIEPDKDNPGHNIIYEFYKCQNAGCPEPNKMEISRK